MSTTKLFGTNGIRGLVNVELTPEMAIKMGASIGTFFGKDKNILIGYDARTSGPMFAKAVISGLMAAGCNVYAAGMASTPAIQFATKNHKLARRSNHIRFTQSTRIQRYQSYLERRHRNLT